MKQIIAFILAITLFLTATIPVYGIQNFSIEPLYDNAQDAYVALSISPTGEASVTIRFNGNSFLRQAQTVTYLEQQVGAAWVRVHIDSPDDAWTYTTTNTVFLQTYTTQLDATGKYRAVTVFTLTGSGVETITKTATASYRDFAIANI